MSKKTESGKWIALGIGVAALAAIAFATYRAVSIADEHWIGIEDDYPDAE